MRSVRVILREYDHILHDDQDEFDKRLNSVREDTFNHIERQIQYLVNVKQKFQRDFDYLDEENKRTCNDNRQRFNSLCISINQNDHNPVVVSKLLEDLRQTFPMRPTMLNSIPEYYYKNIHLDDFIKKENINRNQFEENSFKLTATNEYSFATMTKQQLLIANNDHTDDSNSERNNQSKLLR